MREPRQGPYHAPFDRGARAVLPRSSLSREGVSCRDAFCRGGCQGKGSGFVGVDCPGVTCYGWSSQLGTDDLVRGARLSVVCSTYNFHRSSSLWEALCEVSRRARMSVKLYVDTSVADGGPSAGKLATREIARELGGAQVYQTKSFPSCLQYVIIQSLLLLTTGQSW